MIRYAFLAVAATFIASCNSAPSQTPENAVGGANLVSSATAPFKTGTTSLTLDWGSKAKAGQFAIADVLSYGGPKPTINAPAGWLPICESSTKTTRQSLYGHAIQASDPSTPTWTFSEPVDAQGAILLLDNVAGGWAVDVSSCTAGENGTLTAKPVATTIDGDLILAFNATDFGAYRATACTGCGALDPTLPPDVSVVINQESTAREYWILAELSESDGRNRTVRELRSADLQLGRRASGDKAGSCSNAFERLGPIAPNAAISDQTVLRLAEDDSVGKGLFHLN